jgi:hypothetical protein
MRVGVEWPARPRRTNAREDRMPTTSVKSPEVGTARVRITVGGQGV